MLPDDHPDRIQIAFDDHRLVANAGLILPATLALHLGLPQLVVTGISTWATRRAEPLHSWSTPRSRTGKTPWPPSACRLAGDIRANEVAKRMPESTGLAERRATPTRASPQ